MRILLTIYGMRLRAVRNSFLRRGVKNALGWLVVLLAVGAVAAIVFKAAPQSLKLAGDTPSVGRDGSVNLTQLFISLISFFNISFAMLFLASFPLTIGTYTYRSDLSILLPTPVRPHIVFGEKLLTGILRQYVIVVPLMGPYLIGLGSGLHLPAGFYVCSLLIIALMPIVPTCLGGILTFVFLTLFPPARARTLVTVGGAIGGAVFYLSQEIIWSGNSAGKIGQASTGFVRTLNHRWLAQLPPSWPASALTLAAQHNVLAAAGYVLCFLVMGIACFVVAVSTAMSTFSSGWANYQEASRVVEPLQLGDATPAVHALRRPLFGLSPLVPKEWLVFARDPQQWAALIMPLGVSVYFSYVLIFRYGGGALAPGLRFMLAVGGVNFLISSMVAPLSLTIVNREQRTFILLRSWPLSAWVALRDKFLAIYIPMLVAFEALVALIVVGDHLSWQLALVAAVGVALSAGTLIGWSMSLSLFFPRLDWTNITQMTTWQAWLLSFIGGSALGVLEAIFLAAGPIASTSTKPLNEFAPLLTGIGFGLVLLTAAIVGLLLFVWGPRKLATIEIR